MDGLVDRLFGWVVIELVWMSGCVGEFKVSLCG